MATVLHRFRLDAVVETLLASGVRHVADLGCGHGELLQRLRDQDQFIRLLGIDTDAQALAFVRERLGLDIFSHDERLHVCHGSFENSDWAQGTIDAAVLLETIEHVDPGRLSRVERAVFCQLHPKVIVVTTPNKEYNPLHGLSAGERRHPGHRFEWTRAQFRAWCNGVAERQGYHVRFSDIGPPDPSVGSSTQMACFSRS
ncbi:MAG: methyltransferase domain-containing protein [Thioalkalivibrio sp.]